MTHFAYVRKSTPEPVPPYNNKHVAVRDLQSVKLLADALIAAQQMQLAEYLLAKARPILAGEEALLSEAVRAKDWLVDVLHLVYTRWSSGGASRFSQGWRIRSI